MKKLVMLLAVSFVLAAQAQTPFRLSGNPSNANFQQTLAEIPLLKPATNLRSRPDIPNLETYEALDVDQRLLGRILAEKPEAFVLPLPMAGRSRTELELVRTDPFSDDFSVVASGSRTPEERPAGVFYHGKIRGDESSLVAVSIFGNEVQALISSPDMGNYRVARYQLAGQDAHVLFSDNNVQRQPPFECHTEDSGRGYSMQEIGRSPSLRSSAACVRVYMEVDYDIFQDKGSTSATVNYITALFNEVKALYAKESINMVLSQVYVWSTPSPYSGTDTYALLQQFQKTRTTINGDIGQLVSYRGSGGIAIVDGLCRSFTSSKLSYSGIGKTFQTVPTYSWSVMVVTHELGHLLGSQHTHACVWNGNNTAIDGCPGYVEGSCAVPALPTGGGTIMSYCHLSSAGINLSNGFGPQPGNLIRNRVAAATCLQVCSDPGTGPGTGGGACDTVILTLVLDNYGGETSWTITNSSGQVVQQGGGYPNNANGRIIQQKICLPYACYTLTVKDSYGDGMCCAYGNGSYKLTRANGEVLGSGGQFTKEAKVQFCVQQPSGGGGGGGPQPTNCVQVNFTKYLPRTFGGAQDAGALSVQDAGRTLYIENNAWKAIDLNYTITANTMLAFDFRSTRVGEIHGIGFDTDEVISAAYTFQVFGIQPWGILDFKNYDGSGNWKPYVIPVGKYYTGTASRLFFAADHDEGLRNGNAFFRYVRIYENGSSCPTFLLGDETANLDELLEPSLTVFPNPARDQVTLTLEGATDGQKVVEVYNLTGQRLRALPVQVQAGTAMVELNVRELPGGTYLCRMQEKTGQLTAKFVVER